MGRRIRLYLSQTLSVHTLVKQTDPIVVLVRGSQQEASDYKDKLLADFELFYPGKEVTPSLVFVYTSQTFSDNHKGLYEWVENKIESGDINLKDTENNIFEYVDL